MRVKCIVNNIEEMQEIGKYDDSYFPKTEKFFLELEKEYTVLSIIVKGEELWYFIIDETANDYPNRYPAPLFEITDTRISRFWNFSIQKTGLFAKEILISFPEWIENKFFYDSLTNGDFDAVKKFLEIKKKLELEFPVKSISDKAKRINDDWVECPNCFELFEADSNYGLLECPNCKLISHNPLSNNR